MRCSAENPEDSRYCHKCQAVLPQKPVTQAVPQSLGIQEGVTYREPGHHYETEQIVILAQLVEAVLEGEPLLDETYDHLDQMATNFHQFEQTYAADMQALLASHARQAPEDDYASQMSYLIKKSLEQFQEGCQAFEQFFETESEDPDELLAAFEKVRDGNDYLCFSIELARQRFQELQQN